MRMAVNPKLAEIWENRGRVWFNKGDLKRALEDFDQALQLNPRFVDALAGRGATYLRLGRVAEAERDFARCRELGGGLTPEIERLWREMKDRK
jgi:Flp pilus assembly protein TadD